MTVYEIYRNAERKLDRNEINIGEFSRLVNIEVEPVRYGHWVIEECTNSIDGSIYKRYKCSECGCPTAMFVRSPYCSNCGAEMDVRRERDDIS